MGDQTAPLVLYTTAGCHLCEQARDVIAAVLARRGETATWQPQLRDIAEDEALMERYGIRIPVVQRMDTGEELGWPFDEAALEAFLSGPVRTERGGL